MKKDQKKCLRCGKYFIGNRGLSKHMGVCEEVNDVRSATIDGEVYVHLGDYSKRISKIMSK